MMKYCLYSIAALTLMMTSLKLSAEENALPFHYYKETPYVSGGIGKDEREALTALARQFNTKIVLALKGGDYVSDVTIRISDLNNALVLEGISKGPEFYTKLSTGNYNVEAIWEGRKKQGVFSIKETGMQVIHFYWDGE